MVVFIFGDNNAEFFTAVSSRNNCKLVLGKNLRRSWATSQSKQHLPDFFRVATGWNHHSQD